MSAKVKKIIEKIAIQKLGLETLETRKSDDLDFHDLAVWQIEAALQKAFETGMEVGATFASARGAK